MPPLSDDQIAQGLNELPGWERRGDEIGMTFELATFPAAIQFVVAVAERAETANHHPDIDIRYRKVSIGLTTHDQGGITDKDFALAGEIQAIADRAAS